MLSVVDANFCRILPDSKVRSAIQELGRAGATEVYLIDDDAIFHGKLGLHELLSQKADAPVLPLADSAPISIKHDASQQAIEVASDFVGESIPVINRSEGTMVGVGDRGGPFQAIS